MRYSSLKLSAICCAGSGTFKNTLRVYYVLACSVKNSLIFHPFQQSVVSRANHGDWFLLTRLLHNMNPVVTSYFLVELGRLKEYEVYGTEDEE